MLLGEVDTRLNAQLTGKYKIDTALVLSDVVGKKLTISPTLFLLPLGEKPRDLNRTTGPEIDDVTEHFAVVFAIRDLSGRNEATHDTLKSWQLQVRSALNGWAPPLENYTPIRRGNSGLVSLRNHTLWWQDEYRTRYLEAAL